VPRARTILLALVCALPALALGLWLGGHPEVLPGPLRTAFVDEDRAVRAEVIDTIGDSYFREVDAERLRDASLRGIVGSLGDRFSHYFSPQENERLEELTTGAFAGVGMGIDQDRRGLKVLEVFEKSPAERAGILKGDVIVGVNGRSIAGVPSEVATAKIKGEPGTRVRLSVLTPGKRTRTVEVRRARIDVPNVEARLVRRGGVPVGVVSLTTFSEGAHGQLRSEIEPLLKRGAKGIVLDLRGNGGGLLQESVLVSSLFLEDGVVVSTKGRSRPEKVYRAQGGAIDPKVPMVVLVDEGSASASEIVAGALRDRRRATLVGTKTFGKGVFQEVKPLSNDGALSITVGQYFLPSGSNLSNQGLVPSVRAVDRPRTERDEALPTALRELREKAS
jgi:carboxyl-terminal processing protease